MIFTLPRFGVFAAILVVLVASALWVMPADNMLPAVPGPVPPPLEGPLCFTLSYRDSPRAAGLPRHVTLSPELYYTVTPQLQRFHATTDGADMWQASPSWAFAGLDSVDLTAHHQTWLRFPRYGGTGRALPYGNPGVLNALFFDRTVQFPLDAKSTSCGSVTQ